MGLRFRILFLSALLLAIPPVFAAETDQTGQNSEALEMIAERMRSLTNSLEQMPEPPAFNQKIQLPGDFLIKNNSTESELSEEEKK